ncbi:MAG: hypothetical protein QOD42_3730 [Sphingomonadales bacterium]|nr:hypothetical protein [Sphingomonadales bacterium]
MAYYRACFSVLVALGGHGATANAFVTPQGISEQRQASLNELLERAPAEDIARDREACANGQQPAAVTRSRSAGAASLPDAADLCVTVLIRTGRDSALMPFYRRLAQRVAGNAAEYGRLPERIGAAVIQQRSDRVAIGAAGTIVTAALAFDAGFTAAYSKNEGVGAGLPDMASLRPVAERCLAQAEARLGLCYSAGYAYGARARQGELMRVR